MTYIDWNPALVEADLAASVESFVSYGRYVAHATHLAGTMIAARDGEGMHGIAPAARLISFANGSDVYRNMEEFADLPGSLSITVGLPDQAMKQGYEALRKAKARVVNHSSGLSDRPATSDAEVDAQYRAHIDKIETVAAPTLRDGLIQVWAAGNFEGATADLLAALPRFVPALQPHWLSVVSASADGKLDGFSSRCGLSRDWCVAAPGADIHSTVVSGRVNAAPLYDRQGKVVGLDVAAQQQPVYAYAKMGVPRWQHRTSPPR